MEKPWQKFYTAAGSDGIDKFHLCQTVVKLILRHYPNHKMIIEKDSFIQNIIKFPNQSTHNWNFKVRCGHCTVQTSPKAECRTSIFPKSTNPTKSTKPTKASGSAGELRSKKRRRLGCQGGAVA